MMLPGPHELLSRPSGLAGGHWPYVLILKNKAAMANSQLIDDLWEVMK
jgi:hypothetical protein